MNYSTYVRLCKHMFVKKFAVYKIILKKLKFLHMLFTFS